MSLVDQLNQDADDNAVKVKALFALVQSFSQDLSAAVAQLTAMGGNVTPALQALDAKLKAENAAIDTFLAANPAPAPAGATGGTGATGTTGANGP